MKARHFFSHRLAFGSICLLLSGLSSCSMSPSPELDRSFTSKPPAFLQESWKAYVQRFIQDDGRVIDHKGGGISTSEGQAYAMLRAVWINDRDVFDRTYRWARDNLNSGVRQDRLWAWKWGKDSNGKWRTLDRAFASDADQDAALALILASKTWREPVYLVQAKGILEDLWNLGVREGEGRRYLLAGDTLCQGDECKLNPSYSAPYAYRLFSKYDAKRSWMDLVDTSYWLLERVSELTTTRLPPDWVVLNTRTGALRLGSQRDSRFSYDALRVYWRIGLDQRLSQEPRAERYLRHSLPWLISRWEKEGKLPAVVAASGKAEASYEAPEMLASLLPALQSVKPQVAAAIHERLQTHFKEGIWYDPESYYIQNWVWFGTAVYTGYLKPFNIK